MNLLSRGVFAREVNKPFDLSPFDHVPLEKQQKVFSSSFENYPLESFSLRQYVLQLEG